MADPKTRDEVVAISNKIADEWGIPRLLLLACGVAESNLVWNARRPTRSSDDERFWSDVSGGVWQQTVRYDPEYTGGGGYPGPSEVARILERQYDVERSAHVAAANLKQKLGLERSDPLTDATDEQMLRAMHRYNWPGGAGKAYTAAHEENYRRGLAEARTILGAPVATTPLPFNPDARVDAQPDDWSCSIQSTEWLLRSIGRNPGDQWIQNELLSKGIVTKEHGLMDASGATLAAWIMEQYGTEMGFVAQASPVTFDDIAAGAGVNPTLIGGRAWNHWAGVRKMTTAGGGFALANPADGWKGVGQIMTPAQFSALGPFTAVWIDRMSTLTAPPVPVPPTPAPPLDRAALAARIKAIMALAAANYESEMREWEAVLRDVEAA